MAVLLIKARQHTDVFWLGTQSTLMCQLGLQVLIVHTLSCIFIDGYVVGDS